MKSRKIARAMRRTIAVGVTVALVGVGTTGVAAATTGAPSGAPPEGELGTWCVSTTGAKACFAEYGDRVWVKDTKANGESAGGTIQGPGWARRCVNDRGADAGWVLCDFDVPENNHGLLWAVNNPFIGNSASTEIWTTMS